MEKFLQKLCSPFYKERERASIYNGQLEDKASSQAIFYRSELDYMSRCILDYPNIETGGELLGFWTALGIPVVVYVTGPGKKAKHNYTSFLQDPDYPQQIILPLHKKFRLQHIGEWHSHHQLDLNHPSGGDVESFTYGLRDPSFPRLLMCIGNLTSNGTTINAYNFHHLTPRSYIHAQLDIIEGESPFRLLADKDLKDVLVHPNTPKPWHGKLYTLIDTSNENENIKRHWITEKVENVEMMKSFIKDINTEFPDYRVKTEILPSGEPVLNINEDCCLIILPFGFPVTPPLIKTKENTVNISETLAEDGVPKWNANAADLEAEFKNWIRNTINKL